MFAPASASTTTVASSFSYFSPGYAIGTVTGGPFGVNQQLPFVNASSCPSSSQSFYEGYIVTCGGQGGAAPTAATGNLENPYGTSIQAPPTSPKASDLNKYLPNAYSITNQGSGLPGVVNNGQPISLGVYDRANTLPYTFNYTLDIQCSRVVTSPSNSAMSATSAATKSFPFL